MAVKGHCVQAHVLQQVKPDLRHRDAERMKLAREGEDAFSVDHGAVVVPLHCRVPHLSVPDELVLAVSGGILSSG